MMSNIEIEMEKVLLEAAACLDRRAAMGSTIAMVVFVVTLICWSLAVPFFFLPHLPSSNLTTVLILLALGVITSGGITLGAVKAVGGEVLELRDVIGEFSKDRINIGNEWVKAATDFRKAKVSRYKGGCMYVVLLHKNGGELRIFPSGKDAPPLMYKVEYCRLCERIRSIFTNL